MKVFLSSTYLDLIEHRKAATESLERLGHQVGRMEIFGAQPEEPTKVCYLEVEACDLFVGLYAHRYGNIPSAGSSLSITELEFQRARKHNKPIFCFLVDENHPWPPKMIEEEPGKSKLRAFKARISDTLVRDSFTTPEDLAFRIATSIGRYLSQTVPSETGKKTSPELYVKTFMEKISSAGKRVRLRRSEYRLIELLMKRTNKSASVRELSRIMPPSTVSVAVKSLEEAGIVRKVPDITGGRHSRYIVKLLALPRELARSRLTTIVPTMEIDAYSAYFLENLRKFQSIFATLKADAERERQGKQMQYVLDFSEIHDLLNPELSTYPSFGFILHMFEEKPSRDNFIFPPPAVYELLRHMEKTARLTEKYGNFETLARDSRAGALLKVLQRPPQNVDVLYARLLEAYGEMRELGDLLLLADEEILSKSFPKRIIRLGDMVKRRALISLDAVVDDVSRYGIDPGVYNTVLEYLSWRRFARDESNVIDALNMSLTYNLTEKLYMSKDQYYLLVTHSKIPLTIFNRIRWNRDPLGMEVLVRTPLFMSARSTFQEALHDERERVLYLNRGNELLAYLWDHRDLLVYSERFTEAFRKSDSEFMEEELVPLASLLEKVHCYDREFAPLIQRILDINKEKMRQIKKMATRDIVHKMRALLRDHEVYEDQMQRAHQVVIENLKEAYKVLRNFAGIRHRHVLTDEMVKWLEQLDQEL